MKIAMPEDEVGVTRQAPAPPGRRVKVPCVLQMEAVECGAAALASILGSHGRIVPLEELRVECGVSRDGSKASNIVRAARRYGLVAIGRRLETIEELYDLQFPVILFWNMNHFLVLEGFSRTKAHLCDPASGPRAADLEELDASFSGVVLSFEKGPQFKPGGAKPSMAAALRQRLGGSEKALVFAVLCGIMLVIPGLVVPTFLRFFVDEILVGGRDTLLVPLLLGMTLTACVRMVLTWLQEYCLLRMETRIALTSAGTFLQHVLRLPVTYFSQRYAGEIGARVLVNDKVAHVVSTALAGTVLDCIMLVFYAGLMFLYDFWLTVACIAIALLNIAAVKYVARVRTDASRRVLLEEGKLMGTAMNGLQMIETLKATGTEGDFFSRWAGYQAKSLRARQELGQLGEYVGAVPPLVNSISTAAVLMLGGMKVINGGMTVGMLVAYQSLMASFTRPLNALSGFGGAIQELEADMTRLDDVLRHPVDDRYDASREKDRVERARGLTRLSGKVELREVSFGYSPLDPPLVEGFNLRILPGQRVAIVGMSGSGKSTVAKLIAGLFRPSGGEILFDGIPREELPASLLNSSLAVVDQDIFLFKGTVAENVTMWDHTLPSARISAACRDAAIDAEIQDRIGVYQAPVNEGGTNFSGGQRQRLEIARALAGHPSILILDEATSALDPVTEAAIDGAIRGRACTCIIVAHRLSTIRDADEIIVMERGKIVQRGTHAEMRDVPGPYSHLIQE